MIQIDYTLTPAQSLDSPNFTFEGLKQNYSSFDVSAVPMTPEALALFTQCQAFCDTQLKPENPDKDIQDYIALMPAIAVSLAKNGQEVPNTPLEVSALHNCFNLVLGTFSRAVKIIKAEKAPKPVSGFGNKKQGRKSRK